MEVVDWDHWERLLRARGVVIDRPRSSSHPRYPGMVYPLDYGYIPGATGGDGAEVDVFVGTAPNGLRAALLTTDARKGDREVKLLWGMTDAEIEAARVPQSRTDAGDAGLARHRAYAWRV